jgi:hypothetical protein
MLNTARTVSGAPSAYRNCAHGNTYVRFGKHHAQGSRGAHDRHQVDRRKPADD